ncbi:MAG: ferrous iron transport protein B, partial [Clostridia bacterium]|nr:ferrous iron transport protein B [Clostridia bacterium]
EVVARNFVIEEKPDAIINIVDGTNLERNLYLTVQLMELERPMIIALNMMDEVEKRGDRIDCKKLSLELGVPVVPISARMGQGIRELVQHAQALISAVHAQMHEGFHIEPDHLYDDYTHAAHHSIGELIGDRAEKAGLPTHWAEIKLLEGDVLVRNSLNLDAETSEKLDAILARYAEASPLGDHESMVADSRYKYISEVVGVCLQRKLKHGEKSLSDKIDGILTNKYLAIPLFLVIMLVIFSLTFSTVGAWLSDLVANLVDGTIAPAVAGALEAAHASPWIISLVCDGVIAGVGGVLTFLPQIALLFFCLSLLEDSGYMARTAFIMDRAMRRFGLSGKSFIPLLMGFGCTVPATMGARTMEVEKDRRMTIMLLPFMSCSAKLPVYGLIAGAFFDSHQGLVVFALYFLGIVVGILTGLLFKKTVFKGETAPFVMELPPYRWPTLRNTFLHVWERVKHFLEKAGTLIFAMSVVLWFLQNFTFRFAMTADAAESIIGRVGGFLAPAFRPLGFGAWQAVVALISGFVAKEAVVSSLSVLYGFSAAATGSVVAGALSGTFSTLSAFSFLVFVLLYTPCMAAVATMRRELGSRKWTAGVVVYQIAVAYVAALIVFQLGTLFGL